MRSMTILMIIFLVFSMTIVGCGKEEADARTVSSAEEPDQVETEAESAKTTKTATKAPAADFDSSIEACQSAADHNQCYVDAVTKFKDDVADANIFAYVNICRRILSSVENPEFKAADFDWGVYPTLRMQCFRQFEDQMRVYGNADFAAKELCDDLDGHGISNGDSYRKYCYVEVAEARKYDDTQGAAELCYTMPEKLMRRHCCETVYGKNSYDADTCTTIYIE